jgi:hypothetical protein
MLSPAVASATYSLVFDWQRDETLLGSISTSKDLTSTTGDAWRSSSNGELM